MRGGGAVSCTSIDMDSGMATPSSRSRASFGSLSSRRGNPRPRPPSPRSSSAIPSAFPWLVLLKAAAHLTWRGADVNPDSARGRAIAFENFTAARRHRYRRAGPFARPPFSLLPLPGGGAQPGGCGNGPNAGPGGGSPPPSLLPPFRGEVGRGVRRRRAGGSGGGSSPGALPGREERAGRRGCGVGRETPRPVCGAWVNPPPDLPPFQGGGEKTARRAAAAVRPRSPTRGMGRSRGAAPRDYQGPPCRS